MTRCKNIAQRLSALGYHTSLRESSPGRSGGEAGKERRACNNVNSKCWLAEMTLVMISHVFFNVCLHSLSFPLCTDWWKSDSSGRRGATGELEVEFKFQSRSYKLSVLFPPCHQSAPKSLLPGYYHTNLHSNNKRLLSFRTRADTSHPWRPCFLCPRCQIV